MANLFYNLGRSLGPRFRKGRWIWQAMTGDERDLIEAEQQVGRDLYDAMVAQLPIDADRTTGENVAALGRALAARVADPRRTWRFTVVGGPQPNAFALPGGFVFITRPLLELIQYDRDEAAFVLGHEMGHVLRQHPMNRIFSDTALSAAMRIAPVARGAAGQWLKSSTFKLLQSAYSQDDEFVADQYGHRLSQAAGFDAEAGRRMLQRLLDRQIDAPQLPLAEYFASHPPLQRRIAALEATAPERLCHSQSRQRP